MKPILILGFSLIAFKSLAQIYDTNGDYVQTFVGSGFSGHVDGVGQQTMFDDPEAIVSDSHSNLFVWDNGNVVIRKISPTGTVSTFAGGGTNRTGIGTNAYFLANIAYGDPSSMTIDHNDTIWMINSGSPLCLYKITSGAAVTFYTLTNLLVPWGICSDSTGNIYISDFDHNNGNRIYRYNTNGILSVFAGSGNSGYADGNGIFTAFHSPEALAIDAANNIYVWDSGNNLIRKIDQNQNVTTFAGQYGKNAIADGIGATAAFDSISAMCFDNFGNLVVADDSCIREVSPATNTVTLAGNFSKWGYANGVGNVAMFFGEIFQGAALTGNGVCFSHGTIFVADFNNQRIRSLTNNPQPQIVSGANLGIGTYTGVTINGIVGRTYQIQSSPDLTIWTIRATMILPTNPYLWIDPNGTDGNEFYRALLLP